MSLETLSADPSAQNAVDALKWLRFSTRFAVVVVAGLLLSTIHSASAGGGPSGYLVVYNPNNSSSVTLANHYQQVRGIPERNMFPYDISSLGTSGAWTMVYAIRQALVDRGIASQFQGIALVGACTSSGGQTSGEFNATSLQSFLFLSPNYSATFDSKGAFTGSNYPSSVYGAQPVSFHIPPFQPSAALAANIPLSGHTYWPVTNVGNTGRGGATVRDILSYIDRAKSHDAAKPDGTIYWCLSSDPYRTPPRERELEDVVPVWKHLGMRYVVTNSSWVSGRFDITGGIVGEESVNPTSGGDKYLPGAWADHLTSYGGTLDSYPTADGYGGQMIISAWIRAGADGSSGTYSEPGNDGTKFTNGHIHTHFRNGCSLAESFWQAIDNPAEITALGDPLLQPYADFPTVGITAPAANAFVNGAIVVSVTAQATGGKTLEPNLDLFIDGRRIAIGAAGETVGAARLAGGFSLDTSTLTDGWHEVRVAAYNSDLVRTQSEAVVAINVNNHGQALTLTGPTSVDINSTSNGFTVIPVGSPTITSIDLKMNGRVLATLPATGGTIALSGSLFPLSGAGTLYAVGKFANGQEMLSQPFTINPVWAAQAGVAAPVFGSSFATIRYFADTKSAGFNWDTSAPTTVVPFAGDPDDGLTFNGTSLPGITPDYSTRPGYEADMLFYVPTDDWYEFSVSLVSGQPAITSFSVNGKLAALERLQHLAPGWHRLQFRLALGNSSWGFKVYQRGGPCPYYASIPLSRGAVESTVGAAGTPPQIISATPATSTVTGTTVQLTGVATNPAGNESALTYTWSLISGPSSISGLAIPTFSANGTNAAKVTTATFTRAGTYVFGLQARNATAASQLATTTVTVVQTATKVIINAPTSGAFTIVAGYPVSFVAMGADQFNLPMDTQPTFTWTTTASSVGGTVTREPAPNTGRATFKCSTATTGTKTYTVTAAASGYTSATSSGMKINTNVAPTITSLSITRPNSSLPIQLRMAASDGDDPDYIYVSYKWTMMSAPAGQSMMIAEDYFPTTTATPSGPGTYVLTASIIDGAGAMDTRTVTLQIANDGTMTSSPVMGTQTASPTVLAGDTVTLSASVGGGSITYQWQISSDNGTTWQNIAGANASSLLVGPVATADSGKKYRIVATNSGGSSAGVPITLTVSNPAGGVLSITGQTVSENVGNAIFTVRRSGSTTGALTMGYIIKPDSAVVDSDYTLPGGSATGTLTWADGDGADKLITIPIINDSVKELGLERFYVGMQSLSSVPSGNGKLSSSFKSAYCYISDDDGPGVAYFAAASYNLYGNANYDVREDQGSITLTVKRVSGSVGTLTATYGEDESLQDGLGLPSTATTGDDFIPPSGTLSWASGDTSDRQITIPIRKDLLLEGDETFAMYVKSSTYYSYAIITIVDAPSTSVEVWQDQYWPGVTNPAIIGDTADPDGDGKSNILEYATGSDPTFATSTGLPVVQVQNNRLQISFTRAKQAAEDVRYTVQASDDLMTWTPIWDSISFPYGGGNSPTETVVVQDIQPANGIFKRFLRLQLSR